MSAEKDVYIAELEAEVRHLATKLGEEVAARQDADKKIAMYNATCEDGDMAGAGRTLRESEILTIEAARQLRDRMLMAKLNLDYEIKVALALLDRQLTDLDAVRTTPAKK